MVNFCSYGGVVMKWSNLWMKIFGTTSWLGIDMGFWVSMGISLLVAVIMNVVFWSMKPYKKKTCKSKNKEPDKQ